MLFEISKTEGCTANQLCSILDIDRSYMSRIVRKFEKEDLVVRSADACDARNLEIRLTPKGNALFHELNGRSNEQIHNIIAKLGESDRDALIHAIRAVKKYFSLATKDIVIRDFREEDVEYIIDRQLSLYASERQFTTEIWKKYLTQGVLDLIGKFDAEKDRILILECDGNAAGCIAVTHAQDGAAQLRCFFLEPEMRGLGMGSALLNRALDFCRQQGYAHVFLWTVARRNRRGRSTKGLDCKLRRRAQTIPGERRYWKKSGKWRFRRNRDCRAGLFPALLPPLQGKSFILRMKTCRKLANPCERWKTGIAGRANVS